ncbi:hypothetical protein, partial [Collinsella bouchesdurhonensis]|uniref:hypothetical protein n=1 Tax=Collinsella bouchesdurhonensis TaxID=1907654 RepID=UPI003F8AF90C
GISFQAICQNTVPVSTFPMVRHYFFDIQAAKALHAGKSNLRFKLVTSRDQLNERMKGRK